MNSFALLMLSFAFLVTANAINGKFNTHGGSSCEWNDRSYDGDVNSIFFDCTCAGKSGKRLEYTCEYYGKPSECEMFDKRGGAERFYHQIADNLKGMQYQDEYMELFQ